MADRKLTRKQKEAIIERAAKNIQLYYDLHHDNIREAIDDLKFLNLEQWDSQEVERRDKVGRPALVIDLLNKFVDQIVGDMRLNPARIRVTPADENANASTAQIRQGKIWKIERDSNASQIYDYGGQCAVECGYGAWWVLTRYTEDNPFIQEIYIQKLPNPLACGLDPYAKDPSYADARWGFVLETVTHAEYKRQWPTAKIPTGSFTGGGLAGSGYCLGWNEDTVTVAHYFEVEMDEVEFVLVDIPGEDEPQPMVKEDFDTWIAEFKKAKRLNPGETFNEPRVVKSNTVSIPSVVHYVLSAADIIEGPVDVPGKFIPIVMIKGRERNIEGRVYLRSMVRFAKDPQRLFNFWCTDAAEVVDLIPKAPWQMTAEQLKGYEKDYLNANVTNPAVLLYNHVPDQPPPMRNMLNQVPTAIFEQIGVAKQAVSDAMGMYKPDVGDIGPERTGAAILLRQKPGDISTFVFLDNQRRGIAHTGRIIDSMFADVLDTERDETIIGEDDQEAVVKINTTARRAMDAISKKPGFYSGMDIDQLQSLGDDNALIHSMEDGKYSVSIDTGPSFTTQRQEAADRLDRLIMAYPKLMDLAGDVIMGLHDFIGAQTIAARLKKTVPEWLEPVKEGEPPRAQPPVDPDTQVKMMKLEVQKKSLEIKQANLEVVKMKFLNELQGASSEIRKVVLGILKELVGGGGMASIAGGE